MVLELCGGRIEVPGRVLLEDATMHVERGEHVEGLGWCYFDGREGPPSH